MSKVRVISVAGASGVGKTTISRMLATVCGLDDTVMLSGDDLHRWPRNHEKWLEYTHLHPEANLLSMGTQQVKDLKKGLPILRKKYDHNTGLFTEPVSISPKANIIREGLHTLYSDDDVALADIKIYIETERHLKDRWKIARDITKRGYTLSQVVDAINRRKEDERKYINVQKKNADATILFVEREGEVMLQCVLKNEKAKDLMMSLVDLYSIHKEFISVSNKLARRQDLVQNKGGNMSYRYGDSVVITSSGGVFGQITATEGFTHCTSKGIQAFPEQDRPSMETPVHIKMNNRSVLHTHPGYVLAALCSQEAREIIKNLYGNTVTFVDYYAPGETLAENLKDPKSIVFAKNHGLFVSFQTLEMCYTKTLEINKKIKEFLLKDRKEEYLFPDACVLKQENLFLHGFVESLMQDSNLTPDYLNQKQTSEILDMEAEKYRKQKK